MMNPEQSPRIEAPRMTSSTPYAALGALAGLAASALATAYKVHRWERDFDRRWKEYEAGKRSGEVVISLRGEQPIEVEHIPKPDPSSSLVVVWLC